MSLTVSLLTGPRGHSLSVHVVISRVCSLMSGFAIDREIFPSPSTIGAT